MITIEVKKKISDTEFSLVTIVENKEEAKRELKELHDVIKVTDDLLPQSSEIEKTAYPGILGEEFSDILKQNPQIHTGFQEILKQNPQIHTGFQEILKQNPQIYTGFSDIHSKTTSRRKNRIYGLLHRL